MSRIERLVEEIDKNFPEWKSWIQKGVDVDEDAFYVLWNDLFAEFRLLMIQNQDDGILKSILKNIFENDKVEARIWNKVYHSLENYRSVTRLRTIEKKDIIKGKMILGAIFEKGICRIELGLFDQYKQFSMDSAEEFADVVTSLKNLTDYYIRKNWADQTVFVDFQEETGFSGEMCNYYISVYNKHYQQLYMAAILEDLNELREKISAIGQKTDLV